MTDLARTLIAKTLIVARTLIVAETIVLGCALFATSASAQTQRGSTPDGTVSSQPLGISATGDVKRLRARLGILGGLSMQKTDLALGVSYDILPVLDRPVRLWLTGDFTLGIRAREVTLLPALLVRMPLRLERIPRLEPYIHAGLGMNLTFMRGGTALSFPLRLGLGGHYEVRDKLSVGLQLDAEVGPLVAPFAGEYAALHFGLVVAYDL